MDVSQPLEDDARVHTELWRLRQENEALRESAKIWIRMYEKRLVRATRSTPELTLVVGGRGKA
jgi:hypothetical protein